MKYIGRITATFPFVIISLWLLQHTYHENGEAVFVISILLAMLGIVVVWTLGGQYDKAHFYYKELLLSQNDLQTQKEFLQQLFDSVDATIWSNDIINQRIYVSKGVETLSGYSVRQFYEDYSFWTKIFHPDDRQKALGFYEKVLSGKSSDVEVRLMNVHGEAVWVYLSGAPIFKENSNEVVKINGVIVDISARKKAEAKEQESESRYRSVVELSPNMILIYQNEIIVYANPATVQILGFRNSSDLIGRSIFEFVHPSEKEKVINRIIEISENKIAKGYIEYKIVRPHDGKMIYLEMLGKEINNNGDPAVMVVAIDVTAKKEYQERIKFILS